MIFIHNYWQAKKVWYNDNMRIKNKQKNDKYIDLAKDLDNIYNLYIKLKLKFKHIIKLIKYL